MHYVQAEEGFPGQLGIFLTSNCRTQKVGEYDKRHDSIAIASSIMEECASKGCDRDATLSSSDNEQWGARAMTTSEVEEMIVSFIDAAVRVETAGFEG